MHSAGSKNLGGKPIISTFFIWHNMQKHGEIRIVTAKHMTALSVCLWKSCFIVCNFSSKRSIGWSCGDTGHRRLMFSGLIFFEITSMKRWGKDFDSIYHNMRIQSTTGNFATRLQRSFFLSGRETPQFILSSPPWNTVYIFMTYVGHTEAQVLHWECRITSERSVCVLFCFYRIWWIIKILHC